MMILMAVAVAAAPPCAVVGGNGYTASLVAPPVVAVAPLPKAAVVAKAKLVAKPKAKRAKLSLGCSSHKKG